MFGLLVRQLLPRRRRLTALGVVACWLLLNAQLALAAHLCDMPDMPATTPAVVHHASHQGSHLSQTPHVTAMAKGALCDKHCTPDSGQKTVSALHLDAVAHDSGTLLAVADPDVMPDEQAWLTPPRTGPPVEIVYCRFRE